VGSGAAQKPKTFLQLALKQVKDIDSVSQLP
jgi:hypothetical protein